MKAIMDINIRSKVDGNYVGHGGYCVLELPWLTFGPLNCDPYTGYETVREVVEEFREDIANKKAIALYVDPFDVELGVVLVNIERFDAIDIEVCQILTDTDFRKAYHDRLEQELIKRQAIFSAKNRKEDK